jgi:hypothetical protein
MKKLSYEEIRDSLKSGDIVLFSGYYISSLIIKLFTRTKFNHIGLVYREPESNNVFIWESTKGKGVHLESLSDKIKSYRGKVYIRRIIFDRNTEFYKKFDDCINRYKGRPYEKFNFRGFKELLNNCFDYLPFFRNKKNLKNIFCLELAAQTLMDTGVIYDDGYPSNEFDFGDFYPRDLDLVQGKMDDLILVF